MLHRSATHRAQAARVSQRRAARSCRPSRYRGVRSAAGPASGVATDFEAYVEELQASILRGAEQLDGSGKAFLQDRWERGDANAGYGSACVLEGGDLLEKAAANVTVVRGTLSAQRAQAMSSRGRASIDPAGGQPYSAAAMSLVFHARHPLVPTLRADVRLFEVADERWFGGGADLTPSYLFEEDAAAFHAHWRRVCDARDPALYPRLKAWCDEYFHIPARGEHRGVGGIFFDDLSPAEVAWDVEAFVRDVGDGILPSWTAIAERRRAQPYTDRHRDWQLLRRGRYLEFNLLYDRGVKFGLDGGRMESIMVSAPPLIAWRYNVQAEPGSEEAALVAVLRQPRDWA